MTKIGGLLCYQNPDKCASIHFEDEQDPHRTVFCNGIGAGYHIDFGDAFHGHGHISSHF